MHDGRSFGSQTIKDNLLNLNIKTEFVKISGGQYGGHWVLRVKVVPTNNEVVSMIFYAGLDGQGELKGEKNQIKGNSPELGDFSIIWREQNDNANSADVKSLKIPKGNVWKVKEYVQKFMMENGNDIIIKNKNPNLKDVFSVGYPIGSEDDTHNLLLYQNFFSKEFQVKFFDLIFSLI